MAIFLFSFCCRLQKQIRCSAWLDFLSLYHGQAVSLLSVEHMNNAMLYAVRAIPTALALRCRIQPCTLQTQIYAPNHLKPHMAHSRPYSAPLHIYILDTRPQKSHKHTRSCILASVPHDKSTTKKTLLPKAKVSFRKSILWALQNEKVENRCKSVFRGVLKAPKPLCHQGFVNRAASLWGTAAHRGWRRNRSAA